MDGGSIMIGTDCSSGFDCALYTEVQTGMYRDQGMDGMYRVPSASGVKADAVAYVLPTHSSKLSDEYEGSFMIYNFMRPYPYFSTDIDQFYFGADESTSTLASATQKDNVVEYAQPHFFNDLEATVLEGNNPYYLFTLGQTHKIKMVSIIGDCFGDYQEFPTRQNQFHVLQDSEYSIDSTG